MVERESARVLREHRRRAQQRLRALALPATVDLAAVIRVVADQRSRRIVVQPVDGMGGQTMGAWIATPETDVILYERRTTRVHQDHIVLHELSHLICGHQPSLLEPAVAAEIFPDLEPEVVRGVLARHGYSSTDEVEAEVMASVLSERVSAKTYQEARGDDHDAAVMRRLEAFSQGESLS